MTNLIEGFECPLGKFKLDIEEICGSYNKDPVKVCIECNFGDLSKDMKNLEEVCKCPRDMTWNEYDRLRKEYCKIKKDNSRESFWKFVEDNYVSEN